VGVRVPVHRQGAVGVRQVVLRPDGVDQVRLRVVGADLEGDVEAVVVGDDDGLVLDQLEESLVGGHLALALAGEVVLLDGALAVVRPPDDGAAPHHQALAGEAHRHVGALVRRRDDEAPLARRGVLVLFVRTRVEANWIRSRELAYTLFKILDAARRNGNHRNGNSSQQQQ
jgi:hypothetical protein